MDQADKFDESDIAPGVTPQQLAEIALWPGGEAPGIFQEDWRKLREALHHAGEGWQVWIDWYEARLAGMVRSK